MTLRIDRVTIAVINMDAMVRFYNEVFGADLQLVDPQNEFAFHVGYLAGLELFFCPNEIPQIEANKNRQQLRFVVEDIEQTIRVGVAVGGQKIGDIVQDQHAIAGGLVDPDGNSIELIQYL